MEGTLSPADVAVLSGNRGGYGNGYSGFGGDGAWIVLLLLLAWGNNGNGFFGNGSNGASTNYVLSSDFATLQRQLDSATNSLERKGDYIQEQICNSDQMNSQLFATVNSNLMNGFANTNLGISNNRYETQLAVGNAQNALQSQLSSCCCDARVQSLENTNALQTSLSGINYNLANGNNMLANTMCNNTRDIIEASNANYRALHDEIVANRIADKDAQINELQTALNNANLAASQARQTNQIVDQLRVPTPVPAFNVPMPWSYNGCNNGCGCGNYSL